MLRKVLDLLTSEAPPSVCEGLRPAELKQSYRQHRHTRHESENTHWHHSRAVTGGHARRISPPRVVYIAADHFAGILCLYYLWSEPGQSIIKQPPVSIMVVVAAMVGGVARAEVVQVCADLRRRRRRRRLRVLGLTPRNVCN